MTEEFFSMPVVSDSTAEGLKAVIVAEFSKAGIPLTNMIGFASHNTNVMAGLRGGLATLLKRDIPWLEMLGCVCHSFSLAAAVACDTLETGLI